VGRYTWAGLGNPLLTLDASREWAVQGKIEVPGGLPGDTLYAVESERSFGGAIEFRLRRIREGAFLSIGVGRVTQDRSFRTSAGDVSDRVALALPHRSFGELRLGGGWANARSYPLSISTEKGVSVSLSLRDRRHLSLPSAYAGDARYDGSYREVAGVLRGYLPIPLGGFANQVLALRVSGGAARGPGAGGGHFAVGGTTSLLPVRGFSRGVLYSDAGWAVTGEWRFPIGVVHRGFGPWPFYLDRLAGGVFLDLAGTAGGEGSREMRGSAGVEFVLTHSILFEELDRVRAGVVFPILEGEGASVYIRSGWSF
jgi:hypothetical protein